MRNFILTTFRFSISLFEDTVDGGQHQTLTFIGSIQYTMVFVFITHQPSSCFLSTRDIQQYYPVSI